MGHGHRPYNLVKEIGKESDDFNMLSVKLEAAQDITLSSLKEGGDMGIYVYV